MTFGSTWAYMAAVHNLLHVFVNVTEQDMDFGPRNI